jgi:hypothetical protein
MLILISKKSPILSQLHHHIDNIILNESVPQFDDMRVVNRSVKIDLSFKEKQLIITSGFPDIDLDSEVGTILTA